MALVGEFSISSFYSTEKSNCLTAVYLFNKKYDLSICQQSQHTGNTNITCTEGKTDALIMREDNVNAATKLFWCSNFNSSSITGYFSTEMTLKLWSPNLQNQHITQIPVVHENRTSTWICASARDLGFIQENVLVVPERNNKVNSEDRWSYDYQSYVTVQYIYIQTYEWEYSSADNSCSLCLMPEPTSMAG